MSRRVALVTGAARGIGAATVRRLVAGGWAVVAADAAADDAGVPYALGRPEDLAALTAACADLPGEVITTIADVRHAAELQDAVSLALHQFGGLDAAVAAAGVIVGGPPAWEQDEGTWRTILDVDLLGVWRLARAAIPAMLDRSTPRTGRFVAIASAAGLRGLPRLGAYVAAKHGVIGLVRSLSADLGDSGVTANAICPGSTRTAMLEATASIYDLNGIDHFAQHHRSLRLLDADEPAALAAWLCSADSGGLTGAALPVDGGMTS